MFFHNKVKKNTLVWCARILKGLFENVIVSRIFLRIGGGVIVFEYPRPISDLLTEFLAAICSSSLSISLSLTGSGSSSIVDIRMFSGMAVSTRRSSESNPISAAISAASCSPTPRWRLAKESLFLVLFESKVSESVAPCESGIGVL